jgi:predicted CXXCH cytochrome family protein
MGRLAIASAPSTLRSRLPRAWARRLFALLAVVVAGLSLCWSFSGWSIHPAAGAQPDQPQQLAFAPTRLPAMPALQPLPGSWTDANCNRCHQPDSFSHPVNIVPSMHVPGALPLTDGRIACTTCHDDSGAQAHAQARRNHTSLLRGQARGPAFCAQCHNPADPSRESMHASVLGHAHLNWPRGAAHPADGDSRLCLSCHDGTVARSVGAGAEAPGHITLSSHPVGIDYCINPIHRGLTDHTVSFTAPSQLDLRIRLVDGQVACASCHNLYNAEPGRLVISNLRSRLCLSCHVDLR